MPVACPAIPRATYRLQFNGSYTLADATQIIPYLNQLGISHVYASPYLKARPGSAHGYDIIDHSVINPEIGDNETFAAFCAVLSVHGMGQIIDFVPNHVGILGSDNRWFLDVLRWGDQSPYADFFDIDWSPAKPELHGKLLVPVLGDHYGAILTNGELRVAIDDSQDGFSVWYYDHLLPLAPSTYGRILRPAIERVLGGDTGDSRRDNDLILLAAGFDELGRPTHTRPGRVAWIAFAERLQRDLADAFDTHPVFREHVEAVIADINGTPGDRQSFRTLHELLEAQHYRLAYWRVAAEEINYRRFFQINELAGIRVELPEVFDAIHRRVFEWIGEGRVHGLRIDHIDGLFDPLQYLKRLQQRYREQRVVAEMGHKNGNGADSLYVVIEKVLAVHEQLHTDWPVAGTTGYDFLNLVNGLFVNAESEAAVSACYERFVGAVPDFHDTTYEARLLAMERELASELRVLANEINHLTESSWFKRDYTLVGLRQALREIVASFPVYRTYVDWHGITTEDRRDLEWAVTYGRRRSGRDDLSVFDFLKELLSTDLARSGDSMLDGHEVCRLAMKFQQYTGPVIAKGVEDTAFYRYNRLISLNEVGGEPTRFGTPVAAFHRSNQSVAKRWPHTMLTTATHDTKRGEDARARINALSELVEEWGENVQRWSTLNRRLKTDAGGGSAPSENDEYLFYQSLIGVWPCDGPSGSGPDVEVMDDLRQRMITFMLKAVREAKVHSSWINPDTAYEEALTKFVEGVLDVRSRNLFVESMDPFVRRVARVGAMNSLAQTALKLTAPGVPDIYQGCELWDLSLVDPDNRRPVDFDVRQSLLEDLQAQWNAGPSTDWLDELLYDWPSGRIKLFLTWRLLLLRRALPALFEEGSYRPAPVDGPAADRLCAFTRTFEEATLLVVVPRLVAEWTGTPGRWPVGPEPWTGTSVIVPEPDGLGPLTSALTAEVLAGGEEIADGGGTRFDAAALLATFPIGVWSTAATIG